MSRIGNNPISVPEGVTIDIAESTITVKGKLGELTQEYSGVSFKIEENTLKVERNSEKKEHKAKHGLYRALVNNMIHGVTTGWAKELELVGVGYRASNQGNKLDLALGFSHNIVLNIAPEVKVETYLRKGKTQSSNSLLLTSNLLDRLPPKFVVSENLSHTKEKELNSLVKK